MGKHGYMDGFDETGEDDYEFSINPVIGVRGFRVDEKGRLTGWSFRKAWKNGENVAECHVERYTDYCKENHHHGGMYGSNPSPPCIDKSPCEDLAECSHGFWAYFTDIEHEGIKADTYMAIISGYGKTLVGEKGFRCEKAKIEALAVPDVVIGERKTKITETQVKRTALYRLLPALTIPAGAVALLVGLLTFAAMLIPGFLVAYAAMAAGLHYYIQHSPITRKSVELYWEDQAAQTDPNLINIMRNYPDVKIYPSVRDMLEAYPLTSDEPNDPSHPDFWTHTIGSGEVRRVKKEDD